MRFETFFKAEFSAINTVSDGLSARFSVISEISLRFCAPFPARVPKTWLPCLFLHFFCQKMNVFRSLLKDTSTKMREEGVSAYVWPDGRMKCGQRQKLNQNDLGFFTMRFHIGTFFKKSRVRWLILSKDTVNKARIQRFIQYYRLRRR
jgi:hypothetical protein